MRTSFVLCLLFTVSFAFLNFTFDTRETNKKGLINPVIFFAKHVLKTWSQNRAKPEQVIYQKYMDHVRKVYGKKNATLIDPVSKMALKLYKQLPTNVKKTVAGILESFRNGSIKVERSSLTNVVPKILMSVKGPDLLQIVAIKNKLSDEFLPLAEKVFFNPFDQDNNDKLNSTDVHNLSPFPF